MFCILIVHVADLGCSLEALNWCFCLVICEIIRGCVLTLDIVWRLFFCVYVVDPSLAALIVWISSTHLWEVSKSPTIVTLLVDHSTLLPELVRVWTTLFACSLSTVSVILSLGPGPCGWATPATGPAASEGSIDPVTQPALLLGILGQLLYWCTIPTVCRLLVKGLDLPTCGILSLVDSDALT